MKKFLCKSILIIAGCFSLSISLNAQNWDINLLNNINPVNPNSSLWINTSKSVYPLSAALPLGLLVTGYAKKDKSLQYKGWQAVGAVVINAAITEGLKYTINRQRPYEKYNFIYPYDASDKGRSLPSGHTSAAFATATTLSLEFKKWYVVVPAYAWATGVAYSRLYMGEHYPTDVIAGAVIGTGSAFISNWLTKKLFTKK